MALIQGDKVILTKGERRLLRLNKAQLAHHIAREQMKRQIRRKSDLPPHLRNKPKVQVVRHFAREALREAKESAGMDISRGRTWNQFDQLRLNAGVPAEHFPVWKWYNEDLHGDMSHLYGRERKPKRNLPFKRRIRG